MHIVGFCFIAVYCLNLLYADGCCSTVADMPRPQSTSGSLEWFVSFDSQLNIAFKCSSCCCLVFYVLFCVRWSPFISWSTLWTPISITSSCLLFVDCCVELYLKLDLVVSEVTSVVIVRSLNLSSCCELHAVVILADFQRDFCILMQVSVFVFTWLMWFWLQFADSLRHGKYRLLHVRLHWVIFCYNATVFQPSSILSGTTWVSWHQKGKTRKVKPIWISWSKSGSSISWAICKSAPWPRHIITPASHHLVFYRLDALTAAQPTASKHWSQICGYHTVSLIN